MNTYKIVYRWKQKKSEDGSITYGMQLEQSCIAESLKEVVDSYTKAPGNIDILSVIKTGDDLKIIKKKKEFTHE